MPSPRRAITLGLLMAVMGPSVGALADVARPDAHGCSTTICHCREARPAKPAPARSCHESEGATAPDCQMSARCTHENPAAPGTQAAALVVAAQKLGADHAPAIPPSGPLAAVHDGFHRIDSPPPRPA